MSEYLARKKVRELPRIPLKGSLDLTYRCNNDCRHCWLRVSPDSGEKNDELSFEEVRRIVDEARGFGCRKWNISGGEPMLRTDFADIFDFITRKSASYTLNTNGTLITPKIARLMRREGSKLVALYGATAQVHDHITRNPGSFDALMQGLSFLKEAGAAFTVQVVPMKDNYHQYRDMLRLAEFLSPSRRIGAAWLYLSACGDPEKNKEIRAQRLPPEEVVKLDLPGPKGWHLSEEDGPECAECGKDDFLFAPCISARRDFHIDPYGGMSFCGFIRDPALRYDLREGRFSDAWDAFIPSLAGRIKGGTEYSEKCGSCGLRGDCRWCPVFGFLEHGRYGSAVEYLCDVARESRESKEEWERSHRRYYSIGDMTVQVDSDVPFRETTLDKKFLAFRTDSAGEDNLRLWHHFSLPDLDGFDLGREVYRKAPYAVFRKGDSWIYLGIFSDPKETRLHRVAVFNSDHSRGTIYTPDTAMFDRGKLDSLCFFSSDQSYLCRVLAKRDGCFIHAAGVILDGRSLVFVGHSEAGKSTLVKMLRGQAEILCDDRIILRRRPEGFKAYGTWSHGEVPDVSSNSAPLRAVLFLEKSTENRLVPVEGRAKKTKMFLEYLVRPLVSTDWWEDMIGISEKVADEVPFYTFFFEKSRGAVETLKDLP
jgi:MoaA/NifB/PqqE/SkfB family radical SAM enzyme